MMRKSFLALVVLALTGAAPALSQDVAKGQKIFRKCSGCHRIGQDAKNAIGPVLTGVVGRMAGSYSGYRYGSGMREAAAKGLVWTPELIDRYLVDPKAFLRAYTGNPRARAKMSFKLKNAQDRADVIAYLSAFSKSSDAAGDAQADTAQLGQVNVPQGAVCVQNASAERHFFAAEAPGGQRVTGMLGQGEVLCSEADTATGQATGKVSVFEHADALEGCTRLVLSGEHETLFKYADFDRCLWSSNKG